MVRTPGLVRVQHELEVFRAADVELHQRREQHAVLEIVRILVVEREAAIGIVTLFSWAGLNAQKRIDKSGAGRLLVGLEKECAIDGAASTSGGEIDHGGVCTGCEYERSDCNEQDAK